MAERKYLRCLDDPGIMELAEGLKALADPNRLRILCLLMRGEKCVCEVERELNISQQLASHHLGVLKDAGFLTSRREGTSTYYAVVGRRLDNMLEIMHRYLGGSVAEEGCCREIGPSCSGEASAMSEDPRGTRSESSLKARGGTGR